jgi:aerobic C4-dicarboxylate transport protein
MASQKRPAGGLFGRIYLQVLVAIVLGVLVGYAFPEFGTALKPVGDGFVKLIRMLLAPIVFGTVVLGIARMGDMKEVGRVGLKAIVYFEIVSSLALVIGLVIVNLVQPGAGMHVDAASIDTKSIADYTAAAQKQNPVDFLFNIIPSSVVDSFARGDMLQIILFSVLFGLALTPIRERARPLLDVLDVLMAGLFGIVGMVMRLAPLGAFGAMAFTVGRYGLGSLVSLGQLMISVYAATILFVFGVLGAIARWNGFSLWKFLKFISDEIFVVFGTSSTESVLPQMMAKLEHLGCAKPVVGMVLPAGYTFNADGTSIYLSMAAIFVAQATGTHLTIGDQLLVLAVLLLTSKGSAGVAGAGFVTLAATLASMDKIPVAGLVLLLGVDRFINEARAVTNLIGNGVATIVVARWERAFDEGRARRVLDGEPVPPLAPVGSLVEDQIASR